MKYIISLILTVFSLSLSAQSVGLVLSGGGAKGLYHIGIIKALEENGIPIDYVSGTSMGSIIGGLYSIGYTPDEMTELFLSEQIKYWMSGKIQSRYFYYFKRMNQNQAMVTLNLDLRSGKNIAFIPANIIPSNQIDLAFNEIFAAASVTSKGSFDNLFVPFRCIASDVYNKKEVIYKSGDIGSAIRASMTIPFVFKPLKSDSVLLYDGGIYNNFPWQVLQKDFDPDILIGGKCVSAQKNPDENNIIEQLESITMMRTDYSLPSPHDILINRVFDDVGILDFSKAQYIIDKGYDDTMEQMDSIKSRISRRIDPKELHNRRISYRSKLPDLMFDEYKITGLNSKQTKYVRRMLGLEEEGEKFDFNRFKSEYFKILSEGDIIAGYPQMLYNDSTGYFVVDVEMRTKPSIKVMLGGNISSTSLNQAYVGLEYKIIGKSAHSVRFDGNFSALYTSASFGLRSDFYIGSQFYYDIFVNYNKYNYTKGGYFNRFEKYGYNKSNDAFVSASIGLPLGRSSVLQFRSNYGSNDYYYFDSPIFNRDNKSDKTNFKYSSTQLAATTRTLNYTLFPTRGLLQNLSVSYVTGIERFNAGETFYDPNLRSRADKSWFGARYSREEYFLINKWFSTGYLIDVIVTSHPSFSNAHATNFTSPAFTPTVYSKTIYLDKFRSNSFIGAGIMPTFEFSDNFYLKNSAYIYMPEEYIDFKNDSKSRMRYILSSSLVFQTPIGPASLTLTNFDADRKNWSVVFNFGYTIFNKKGLFY